MAEGFDPAIVANGGAREGVCMIIYQRSLMLTRFMGHIGPPDPLGAKRKQGRGARRDAGPPTPRWRASVAQKLPGPPAGHPAGRCAPSEGPGAFCRQRRRAPLVVPAPRRNALLTGDKNQPKAPRGEMGQYQRPLVLVSSGSVMATWMPRFRSAARLDSAFDGGPRAMGFRRHG